MKFNLYLDDIRATPFGFHLRAHNYDECIYFLEKFNGQLDMMSLDHDLGDVDPTQEKTGYDVMKWIEEERYVNLDFRLPKNIVVHSSNPAGRKNMQLVIDKLYGR